MGISFSVSKEDRSHIDAIASRFCALAEKYGTEADKLSCVMDLTAVHANGTPLQLAALAEARDVDLAHDVGGIARHLCRDTASLGPFLPRFAATDHPSYQE